MAFESLEQIIAAAFEAARPADYMTVTEAGERYNYIRQPGSYTGYWSRELTPYLVEPQDEMLSLDYTAVVFQAPARTGKSMMLNNLMAYSAMVDPHDILTVHSEQHKARDWSLDDLKKFLRNSKEVRAKLLPGRKNDNTYDKEFITGQRLTLVWPTEANLSGKTVPWHWLLDYDRMEDSIEKMGNAFDLTRKRGTTFKRFAMTVAESSPGRLITNPKWIKKTPHEGPPVKGIGALYNRGDRRRLYWECLQCHDAYEAHPDYFDYPGKGNKDKAPTDFMEAAEQTVMVCPHCGFPHEPKMKEELNAGCTWVKDGMIWVPQEKRIHLLNGYKQRRTKIASFAMFGPAAAFQNWTDITLNLLDAQKEYDDTGDEEPLKKVYTTDLGLHYTPQAIISDRTPDALKAKAEDWGATSEIRTVPPWVRFLIATVDVQARSNASFPFQVHGFGADGSVTVIDSDRILKSNRFDEAGDRLRVDPAAHKGDWDMLLDLMRRTYPLGDGSGRRMGILFTGCDSGGVEGVATNAYDFWRRLKEDPDERGLHRKFGLIKGRGGKGGEQDTSKPDEKTPPTRVLWPESNRTDRFAGGKGDVPVIELNPWLLKDRLSNMLLRRIREDAMPAGSVRYPSWLPDWFYTQVTAEVRTAKGWEKVGSRRNEAWDLLYYAIGVAVRPKEHHTEPVTGWMPIRFDRIDWDNPPDWAKPWDQNSLVWSDEIVQAKVKARKKISLADLGSALA